MAEANPLNISNEIDKDDELEELLDSAIEDFNNIPLPPKVDTSKLVPKNEVPMNESNLNTTDDQTDNTTWNDEFLLEAQKHFEKNMKEIFGQGMDGEAFTPEKFEEQLNKMSEEANKVLTEQSRDPDVSSTIAETLRNLTQDSQKAQQSEMGADALAAMLGSLGMGSDDGDNSSNIFPFMQSMMESFLSKELLYPSLKEITDKYPSWIEEHKSTLPESEYDNFNKQYKLMEQVCVEYEKETPQDSDKVKKDRFMKILGLMEEIQKFGHPPKDLVGDECTFYDTNAAGGLPAIPDPNQCSLM